MSASTNHHPGSSGVTLTGLFVYPVKSARGIALREATLGDRGITHDRRFMVVDEKGHFVTQREVPRMALLGTAIVDAGEGAHGSTPDAGHTGELVLSYEGQQLALPLLPASGPERRVRVFKDEVDALDVGDAARDFLSAALGRAVSLVYMPDLSRRQVDPTRATPLDLVGFADGFPYLLANESSLAAVNRELTTPVTMERFRPNFVIEGVPAYAEDNFGALTIGALRFEAVKTCSRCVIVNTDQRTGHREKGPLEALVRTHVIGNRPIFGQNLVARSTGRLAVGDPVDVTPPS